MQKHVFKNIKLKLTGIAIIASFLASNVTAYASTTKTYTNGQTSGSIHISAVVGSTYTVSLPATLNLEYNSNTDKYEGTYTVGVKANLTDDEKVTVTPASTVELSCGENNSVEGTVAQTVDTWKTKANATNEIESNYQSFVETTGTVSVSIAKAGTYEGDLQFVFSKSSL